MNILVIDRAPPCDLLQGNALNGQHLFRRLRHHHLTIICPAPASTHERYRAELAPLFDTIHLVAREQPIPALMRAFQARVRSVVASSSFDIIHTRQLPMAAVTASIKHPAKLLELIDSETLQASRRVRSKAPQTWLR